MTWTLKTSPVSSLPKYTTVFGVPVFAASSTTAAQFQHAASVLAAWLDNDGDGCVDNPTVLTKLTEKQDWGGGIKVQASIIIPGNDGTWTNALSQSLEAAGYTTNAPIYNGELLPSCSSLPPPPPVLTPAWRRSDTSSSTSDTPRPSPHWKVCREKLLKCIFGSRLRGEGPNATMVLVQ